MQVEDMIFISVDDHLVEPPHLFEGRLPAKFADRAPRVEHTDAGDDVWVFDHQTIPNIGLNAVAGRPKEEYGVNPTAFDEMRPGCYDVHERVKDMSAGGVLACMCFPSFPSFSGRLFLDVPPTSSSRSRSCRPTTTGTSTSGAAPIPGRFIPMALPVLWDPELSAAEVRRVAKKGCHSLTFTENPATLGLPSFHDAHWDPLWRALVEEGTILNIHLGSSGQLAVTAPDAPIDVMITLQPINICQAAADLVWSRVFKEFPTLRVALSEGGTGWIPYFLDRLDRTYDMHHLWTGQDFGDRTPVRRVPRAHPHVLHRRPDRPQAPRRHRRSTTSAGSRTTRTPTRRGRTRPRSSPRSPRATTSPTPSSTRSRTRTRCAGTGSIRSHTGRASSAPSRALRAEVPDHDVAIRAMDKGRFAGTPTMTLGELAENATA